MRIYRVQDFKRVVLFDDKPSNVSDAIAIGIVGIQIATPANGDNPNGGKMYFGPWIMDDFDKQIKKTCGDEIYLNRTYTGMASKENYIGFAYDNQQGNGGNGGKGKGKGKGHNLAQNEINYGTGIRAKDNYFQEPYDFSLDVDDSSIYRPVAFGTGIGDRKVLTNPQFRWNGYKNSQKIMPKWYNGNYVNIPGVVNTEGYWNEGGSLGGASMSYWDVNQKVMNDNPPGVQHINPQNKDLSDSEDTVLGVTETEGFSSYEGNGDCGCRKFEWNWIILLLVLLIVVMAVIVIRC
jgi:hypothetical protein